SNQQIIDREAESQDVYFVVTGKVRVVNYSLTGREISFDDIEQGGYFGELAALDAEPRSANIVALAPTTVAIMTPSLFHELLAKHSAMALKLIHRLVSVIRTSTGRIMDLSTLGAHNRVDAELLRLAQPGMRDDNTAVIKPVPIHGDIASRVSTTRETVTRVLSDLARAGIVERTGNALVIQDVNRLEEMVEKFRGA
ncbi:MAG: Crp/Fnr family transcriptional regulator, partial [Kiloniellales bacterium]